MEKKDEEISLPKKRRQFVRNPCFHCKSKHTRCTDSRPCERCVRLGLVCFTADVKRLPSVTKKQVKSNMSSPETANPEMVIPKSEAAKRYKQWRKSVSLPPVPVLRILTDCVSLLGMGIRSVSCPDEKLVGVREEVIPDVTNQEPVKEDLSRVFQKVFSSHKFRTLCDQLNGPRSGVVCFVDGGRIVYVTDCIIKVTGYSYDELVGKGMNLLSMMDGAEMNSMLQYYYERTMNSECKGYESSERYLTKEGKPYHVLTTVGIVRSEQGFPVACVGFVYYPDIEDD